MTTRFAAAETKVSAAIDGWHGEMTRVSPRAAGQFVAGGPDPSRSEADVIGIIDFNPLVARIKDRSEYDGFRPEVEGERVHVTYATSRFASPAAWPRAKDHIEALDRPGSPAFQVVTVEPDGLGRILCKCVPVTK